MMVLSKLKVVAACVVILLLSAGVVVVKSSPATSSPSPTGVSPATQPADTITLRRDRTPLPTATQPATGNPFQSQRFKEMRVILEATLMYVNDHRMNWPTKLDLVRPYLPKDAATELDAYVYQMPPRHQQLGNLPILIEKLPSRPDGLFIGFDDTHVDFLKPADAEKQLAGFHSK